MEGMVAKEIVSPMKLKRILGLESDEKLSDVFDKEGRVATHDGYWVRGPKGWQFWMHPEVAEEQA
jgi:hypothetical protein